MPTPVAGNGPLRHSERGLFSVFSPVSGFLFRFPPPVRPFLAAELSPTSSRTFMRVGAGSVDSFWPGSLPQFRFTSGSAPPSPCRLFDSCAAAAVQTCRDHPASRLRPTIVRATCQKIAGSKMALLLNASQSLPCFKDTADPGIEASVLSRRLRDWTFSPAHILYFHILFPRP